MELRVSFRYGVQVTSNCSQPLWKEVVDVSQKTWNLPYISTVYHYSVCGTPLFQASGQYIFNLTLSYSTSVLVVQHMLFSFHKETNPESFYHKKDVPMFKTHKIPKATLELDAQWCTLMPFLFPSTTKIKETWGEYWPLLETEASGILLACTKIRKAGAPLRHQKSRNLPLGQNLSWGA
jgi:hypothetical protein